MQSIDIMLSCYTALLSRLCPKIITPSYPFQSLLRISLRAILPNFKILVQVIVLKFLPTVRFFHGNVEAGFFLAVLNEYEQNFNMAKPLKVSRRTELDNDLI